MIKPWIIIARAPFASDASIRYGAYSEKDPLEHFTDDDYETITDELWNSFSYLITNSMDDPDDEEEYEQTYELFREDCEIYSEEDTDNEVEDYEIIYDERD